MTLLEAIEARHSVRKYKDEPIPEKRGLGYGKALLKYVAKLAVQRNCGRMEWICLDWNEPSLRIYRSIGAVPMSDWTVQRLDEQALKAFAKYPIKIITYRPIVSPGNE